MVLALHLREGQPLLGSSQLSPFRNYHQVGIQAYAATFSNIPREAVSSNLYVKLMWQINQYNFFNAVEEKKSAGSRLSLQAASLKPGSSGYLDRHVYLCIKCIYPLKYRQ